MFRVVLVSGLFWEFGQQLVETQSGVAWRGGVVGGFGVEHVFGLGLEWVDGCCLPRPPLPPSSQRVGPLNLPTADTSVSMFPRVCISIRGVVTESNTVQNIQLHWCRRHFVCPSVKNERELRENSY